MRTALSAAAVALLIAATIQPANADRRQGCHRHKGSSHCWSAQSNSRASAEYDRARAEAFDPGGSYKGYPDWARYALSPKSAR